MLTRVASIQLPFTYYSTPQEFADHIRAPLELAAQNGTQLILLPHLTSAMLFGMFDFDAQPNDSLATIAARQNVSTAEWLDERASYVFEFYLHLFQSLASRVETWLAPGTVFEPENETRYLSAFLFNPQGEIVGRQRQMHPSASELETGVSTGDTLRVFETDIGNFGFLIAEDVTYPEISQALAKNGADIFLNPSASANGNSEPDALQRAVESNRTFGVRANLAGANFRGGSAIYAPSEMTEDKQGILASAEGAAQGELVLADLDLNVLQERRA